MQPRPRQIVNCPHCGIENPSHQSGCRACGKNLTVYIGPAQVLPRRLGLGALMALVAVVAPGLALLREVPVLGVLVLLLFPAAVIRTTAAASQATADLRPLRTEQIVQTFLASISIVTIVLVSSLVSFLVASVPVGAILGIEGLPFAIGLGGVLAMYVGYRMIRYLWPYSG